MRRYTAAELAFVKRRRKMPRRELLRTFKRKFRRPGFSLLRLQDLCNRNGWNVGSLKGRTKGRSSRYGKAELAFIRRRRKMERRELHAAFMARFKRSDVSCDNIRQLCKRNGWLTDPADRRRRMLGRTKFSNAELAFIRRRRQTPRSQLHAEFVEKFGRQMTLGAFKSLCKKIGAMTGRTGGFEKGHVPWSKGKKIGTRGNAARTQFKKGQRPHNTKPPGHEWRHSRQGYTIVSVEGRNPYTGGPHRHELKHRLLWEKRFGPLPKGIVLKCKGDPANADPSNWEAVPRGVLPRLNGKASRGRSYDKASADLKPTIMAVAKLEHRLAERSR